MNTLQNSNTQEKTMEKAAARRTNINARAALFSININDRRIHRHTWEAIGLSARDAGLTLNEFAEWTGSKHARTESAALWESDATTKYSITRIAASFGRVIFDEPSELWAHCSPATDDHPDLPVLLRGLSGAPEAESAIKRHFRVLPTHLPLEHGGKDIGGKLVAPLMDKDGAIVNLEVLCVDNAYGGGWRDQVLYAESGWGLINASDEPLNGDNNIYVTGDSRDAFRAAIKHGGIGAYFHHQRGQSPLPDFLSANPQSAETDLILFKQGRGNWLNDWCSAGETVHWDDGNYRTGAEIAEAKAWYWLVRSAEEYANNSTEAPKNSKQWKSLYNEYLAENAPAPKVSKFSLIAGEQLAAQPSLTWRIAGVLPAVGIAGLYGASGSGKSFLALDMAAAIAGGEKWFDKTSSPAPVVYIVLENENGFAKRVAAWECANRRKLPGNLHLVMQPFTLTEHEDVSEIAAIIPTGAVVIIDTLNRAAPNSDENSGRDMGEILSASKRLQALTSGLVVLVHHTGKDASRGARGHSSFYAALDAAILVKCEAKKRAWVVHKAKDDKDGDEFPFTLDIVPLGVASDGEQVTSCVIGSKLKAQTKPDAKRPILSKANRLALDVLRFEIEQHGTQAPEENRGSIANGVVGVSEWRWRDAVIAQRNSAATDDAKRKAFLRVKNALVKAGLVSTSPDFVWLP